MKWKEYEYDGTMKGNWVKEYNERKASKKVQWNERGEKVQGNEYGLTARLPERSTKEQSKQVKVRRNTESEYE